MLFCIAYTNVYAKFNTKSTLSGTITDAKTNKPLQGATVVLYDAKITVITDKNGYYKTPQLNNGKYLIEISYVGYASIIEHININEATIQNYSLQERVTEQEAVTITGSTFATKAKANSQPIVVVNKQDLYKTTSTNLIESLSKTVSGLSVLTTGAAIAKPVIRGLGYNRMVTINDGVRQEGQQWGDEHGIEIDEASVQKVEVLKGASSLMYGSDAMAGVLNIITNQPIQLNSIKSNIQLGYIDNNKMFNTHINIAGHLKNGFNFNVYNSTKSAGDYSNEYDGKVLNSRFNENNFGGYIGVNKHWGYSHLLVSSFNQKLGLIEGSRDSATGAFTLYNSTSQEHIATNDELNSKTLFIPYQSIHHFKITSDNNFNLKKTRLNINIAYQHNIRKEFGDINNTTQPNLYFDLKTTNYNIQYHWQEKKGWKTSIGVNGMGQINNNRGLEVIIPEYNQFDIGSFLVTKKTFGKLNINGGARFDKRNVYIKELKDGLDIKFIQQNKSFTNFSSSIGFSYNFNDSNTLKFNIAKGFRAPTVTELSSNGAHEGTNRYEYGNNNLKSENSLQIDLGFESTTEHVSFSINTFYNYISNYIFYNKLASLDGKDSLINIDGKNITAFQFNQSNAMLVGFEANLDIHPHPLDWLHLQNSFSYVRGKFINNVNGSENLPFMPQPKLLSEIKAEFKKCGSSLKNLYLKFQADNYFAQNNIYNVYNTETTTPAYTLSNVGLGSDVIRKNKTICSVYFAINNIADVAYQNHLSRLKYTDMNNVTGRMGVFNMGRNFSVKLLIPLSFELK